ncbi:MAG: trehalose-6-phosphate synthase [Xanthobacteraceae bacterium]
MSVILVSNRVADPKPGGPIEGGLTSALIQAVKASGAIWVGTSGRLSDASRKEPLAALEALGSGTLARLDLPGAHYQRFYEGFANSALWPVLHSRPDLIRTDDDDYASYRQINAFMARALRPYLKPNSLIWIHDYHFLALAQELRELEVDRPTGFFLHTPFPHRSAFGKLPHHRELAEAMLHYDLLGFQTARDQANFVDYVEHELQLAVVEGARVVTTGTRLAAFPIGIDPRAFAEQATKAATRPEVSRLRASLQGGKLAIGVDRIDYSKGLDNRFRAIDRLFTLHPRLRGDLSLLQVAVPSRGQIDAYSRLQTDLAALVGEINGRHGDIDWVPIRYVTRGFAQSTLAGLYRTARVGLVTPFFDGMNLVAKEYVAAQNPLDPGVLVLSEFAGAAAQLDAALLVNPHDVDQMAATIVKGLSMAAEERRERWQSMMTTIEDSDINSWYADFMAALAATSPDVPEQDAPFVSAERATLQSR